MLLLTYLLIGVVVAVFGFYISFKENNLITEYPWLDAIILSCIVLFWPIIVIGYIIQIIQRENSK